MKYLGSIDTSKCHLNHDGNNPSEPRPLTLLLLDTESRVQTKSINYGFWIKESYLPPLSLCSTSLSLRIGFAKGKWVGSHGAVLAEADWRKAREDTETTPRGSKISNRWQFSQPQHKAILGQTNFKDETVSAWNLVGKILETPFVLCSNAPSLLPLLFIA